jgi:acyl dehydratase
MTTLTATMPARPATLAAGDEMPVEAFGPVTRTDFVRYAGAGGDLNPIHHDEPMAQAAGFPTVFGMGLFHAGVLGNRVARWVGPANLRSFGVRFTGQVWPGDVLTITGTVDEVDASGDEPLARISLSVASEAGEVLRGTATAVVAETSAA